MGLAIRAAFKWAHYAHILVLVTWLLILFCALLRGRIVPPILAALGIAASCLHMVGIPLPELLGYRLAGFAIYGAPLAVIVLLTGGWLLWKGTSALTGNGRHQ